MILALIYKLKLEFTMLSFEINLKHFIASLGLNSHFLKLIFVVIFQPIREPEFMNRLGDLSLSSKDENFCSYVNNFQLSVKQ